MDPKQLLSVLRRLEGIGIGYVLTGSIASILYGRPRLTQDMDLVIALPVNRVGAFIDLFPPAEFYCPPEETIREEIGRPERGHFNLIDQATGFKIDLYPAGKNPLVRWAFENKRRVELLAGEAVWLPPPEYVILMKLIFYQEGGSQKHLEDIEGMLAVSGDQIDLKAIEGWVNKLGLAKVWATFSSRPSAAPR